MITNTTVTIVAYEDIPRMMENQWEFVMFNPSATAFRSTGEGSAVLKREGEWDTRRSDGLQKGLKPKRGESLDGAS